MTNVKAKHLTDVDLESLEVGDTIETLEFTEGAPCSGVVYRITKENKDDKNV